MRSRGFQPLIGRSKSLEGSSYAQEEALRSRGFQPLIGRSKSLEGSSTHKQRQNGQTSRPAAQFSTDSTSQTGVFASIQPGGGAVPPNRKLRM